MIFNFVAGYIWHIIQTTIHRNWVFYYTVKFIYKNKDMSYDQKIKLLIRGICHDLSKYSYSESKYFAKVIFGLKRLTYGSKEYMEVLESIDPALKLHYSRNSHHPEYWNNGFKDMGNLDKIEMIADWICACKRHTNGNINSSLEFNQKRFNYRDKDKDYLTAIVKLIT